MSTDQKPLTMSDEQPLSTYVFSEYGHDAKLYNGIRDLEIAHAETLEQLGQLQAKANSVAADVLPRLEYISREVKEQERELAETREQLAQAQEALADEWPDLDNLPELTPDQVASENAEHAEWIRKRTDAQKDTERLDWLLKELNEMYSNASNDVMGWAREYGGDVTREAIDAALHAKQDPDALASSTEPGSAGAVKGGRE